MKAVQALIALTVFPLIPATSHADTLGAPASTYAVLGASEVTNTGSSVISGNVGVSPAAATFVTGFPPGVVNNGTIDNADAAGAQGVASTFDSYLAGLSGTSILPDLSGQTLMPGVYSTGAALLPTGDVLTLDFGGINNAAIVLQIASTLTTGSYSAIKVENLGTNDNVYYQVGSSATLGSYSVFQGDILANTSISLDPYAEITCGSAIALTGAVTLSSNTINNCSSTGSNVTAATVTPTPEPGALLLFSTGLLAGAGLLRRRLFV